MGFCAFCFRVLGFRKGLRVAPGRRAAPPRRPWASPSSAAPALALRGRCRIRCAPQARTRARASRFRVSDQRTLVLFSLCVHAKSTFAIPVRVYQQGRPEKCGAYLESAIIWHISCSKASSDQGRQSSRVLVFSRSDRLPHPGPRSPPLRGDGSRLVARSADDLRGYACLG